MHFPLVTHSCSSQKAKHEPNQILQSITEQNELIKIMRKINEKISKNKEGIQDTEDEFTKDVKKITNKIYEDNVYIQSQIEAQIRNKVPVNTNKIMSEMEIDFVYKHFDECRSNHDIIKIIDMIFKGLKFFKRMNKENRQSIISSSDLKIVKTKEFIIRQGEIGSHMYIILKGWVNIKIDFKTTADISLKSSNEATQLRQIAWLFDGDHFGEMALIDVDKKEDISLLSSPKKRKAHWIAADEWYLLEVPHYACMKAYQATGAQGIQSKLDFLVKLPGFRMVDKNTLLPLVSNIQVKKYKIGKHIVKQREMPEGLIIIHKGECIAGYEKQRTREFHSNVGTGKDNRAHSLSKYDTFQDPNKKTTLVYDDMIQFYKLHSGNMIGYRTMMPLEVYINNKKKSKFENEFLQTADNEKRQKFYNESCISIVGKKPPTHC